MLARFPSVGYVAGQAMPGGTARPPAGAGTGVSTTWVPG